MELEEYYRARDIMEELLRKDLYGPVAEDEVISDTWPHDYYICGMLFPQEIRVSPEETEGSLICSNGEGYEVPINLCYSNRPSSIAITFTVRSGIKKLRGEASFAWYIPEPDHDGQTRSIHKNWHRRVKSVSFEINLDGGQHNQVDNLHPGLELRTYIQKSYPDGARTLTVALVNTMKRKMDWDSNCASTFFQSRIVIRGLADDGGVFIERTPWVKLNQDPELLNLEMLYRHNPTFATGHGCSVGWKSSGDYATEIYSEYIPAYEVRQMEPALHVRPEVLAFRFLASGPVRKVCAGLEEMAASYEQWINEQESVIDKLPERYHKVARTNICNCRESLARIRSGIRLLETDGMVCNAFQLMNRAMLYQYEQRIGKASGIKTEPGWYPFQLAFILQETTSIAIPGDPYREVVDLLWFPTGGGKTEAYLGLAALTIFLRRMREMSKHRSGGGVTTILRYTLRLLTLQQFERAAALICACELIRRENCELLGNTEIAAGLWVGGGLTPNRRDEAERLLKTIMETPSGMDALGEEEPNPCQVMTCPWCGARVRVQDYSITPNRMKISCPRKECPFHEGLPVCLVDEDIYDHGPSLIVSTIDKFARMTWQPEVGKLFGLGTEWQPPELIIQDELHLISGPLGTVSGLYEVAIDEFCRNNGVKAKIVSSTATIRNGAGQIRSLYGRECRQFPAQGLDIRDSYFAREASETDRPTRRYLGVLTPGVSGTTRLVRVYSVLLMVRNYLEQQGFSKEVIDSFWTLTGYFNTLKDLGGAVVNVLDDVQGRLKYLYRKKFSSLFPPETNPPIYLEFDELTSRKKSSEIAEVLNRLEINYPMPGVFDLILASSMLSVGIDIGRLGLMVMQGQPKSNSEYIQATSRVGRKTPGLVVTMYDASRSRDRSHYEQFRAYHASLYRYVEATSLTPFADRARDRALHAVFISLCRHLINDLRNNAGAGRIRFHRPQVEAILQKIVERAGLIDDSEVQATQRELNQILEHWERMALNASKLVYQKFRNQPGIPLLTAKFDGNENAFPTLNSMRDVDIECDVFLEG